jgi:GntR family transcriptional regulator of arabinose operon
MLTTTSKHEQLTQILERDISAGVYSKGQALPSQNVLAGKYGVAVSTVREALSALTHKGLIRREQGRGTFVAAAENKPKFVIALSQRMLQDSQNPYWANLLKGISQAASQRQVEVIVPTRENSSLWKRADGMLITNRPLYQFESAPPDFPFVSLLGQTLGADCVISDDYSGVYQLTEHLLSLGHRRIAMIYAWKQGNINVDARYEGHRDALRAAGIPYQSSLVRIHEPIEGRRDPLADAGYEAMRRWLQEGFDATAVLAYNDPMAVGIIRALREAGVRVPEDVSVTGYDGTPGFDYFHPRLTTIRVPLSDIGRAGIELLIRKIQEEADVPALLKLPVKLIPGESTSSSFGDKSNKKI